MLVAAACGSKDAASASGSGAGAATTWKVAGADVPFTVVPRTVELPTGFPQKIGDAIDSTSLATMEHAHDGVRLYYAGAWDGEDPKKITGYVVRFGADPVPDLTKAWGPPTSNVTSGDHIMVGTESNACWDNAKANVRACVQKLRDKTFFDLETRAMTK